MIKSPHARHHRADQHDERRLRGEHRAYLARHRAGEERELRPHSLPRSLRPRLHLVRLVPRPRHRRVVIKASGKNHPRDDGANGGRRHGEADRLGRRAQALQLCGSHTRRRASGLRRQDLAA